MGPPKAPQRKQGRQVQDKTLKRKRETEDVAALDAKVAGLDAKSGSLQSFTDLPLSQATASGLAASHFKTLTDIQERGIPLALQGRDILGAAKTGSGKTLAFLVPVLENLYRKKWTEYDGLGALILSPTRELAIQIFEVLRKVGRYHNFSAGLVIGGKSLQDERERLGRMNILVCTPGRMLQHLDQTALLEIGGLQMLVLDEADRIMDMGFQSTVDAIVEHLPPTRQTLLFSATQTKKVSDLARLSLRDPQYVAVHEGAANATPAKLQQNYVTVDLPDKLDTLWSFLRANSKAKILVFFSSGKQVRFVYESFRHMQPGIPLLHLHGRQRQTARLEIVTRFASSTNACLFSTDVAARGLDFPAVDWVVQLDCPEDADTYIHRVGRTARFEKEGRAVIFLDPTEAPGMLSRLEQKKVPIEQIGVRQKKQQSIKGQLQNMCFKDPELKYLGQKAFISYAKSVNMQKDKEIFRINDLPLEEYSKSLGLPGAPKIKFRKGQDMKIIKNAPRQGMSSSDDEDDKTEKAHAVRTKYDRMFERRNQDVLAPHYASLLNDEAADDLKEVAQDDPEADFLTVKRHLSNSPVPSDRSNASATSSQPKSKHAQAKDTTDIPRLVRKGQEPLLIDSHRREKLLKSRKKLLKYKERGRKLIFDEEGNAHEIYETRDEDAFRSEGAPNELRQRFVEGEMVALQETDIKDKQAAKDKRREKKEKRKEREKAEREDGVGGREAVLGPRGEEDGDVGEDLDGLDLDGESNRGEASASSPPPKAKKEKKWFQRDSDEEDTGPKGGKRGKGAAAEADTLEDLEALAESYL